MAEEKIKKRVAAKKMEEAEARRKQDEDARKLKALQLVRAMLGPAVQEGQRCAKVACSKWYYSTLSLGHR